MRVLIIILAKDISGFGEIPNELKGEFAILAIQDPDRKSIAVKVFSDKNIKPIDIEQLKKMWNK